MVEMGKTATVFAHPKHEYTQSLLKAALYIQKEEGTGNRKGKSHFKNYRT